MYLRSDSATALMCQLPCVLLLFGSVASALRSPPPPSAQPLPPLPPGWVSVGSAQGFKDAAAGQRSPAVFVLSVEQIFRLGDLMPPAGAGFLKLENRSLTLVGAGSGATLDAEGQGRLFYVMAGNLTLTNLRIVNGVGQESLPAPPALTLGQETTTSTDFRPSTYSAVGDLHHFDQLQLKRRASLALCPLRHYSQLSVAIFTLLALSTCLRPSACPHVRMREEPLQLQLPTQIAATVPDSDGCPSTPPSLQEEGGVVYAAASGGNCIHLSFLHCVFIACTVSATSYVRCTWRS